MDGKRSEVEELRRMYIFLRQTESPQGYSDDPINLVMKIILQFAFIFYVTVLFSLFTQSHFARISIHLNFFLCKLDLFYSFKFKRTCALKNFRNIIC